MYLELTIVAASEGTEIWLGDGDGHFVQKEVGTLTSHLLAGDYVVSFALGAPTYPIALQADSRFEQAALEAIGPCPRPALKWPAD